MSTTSTRRASFVVIALLSRIRHSTVALQLAASSSDAPLHDVFLVAGQSNAQGFGYSHLLEDDLRIFPPQMLAWSNGDGPNFEYGNPDWRWRPFVAGSPLWAHDERDPKSAPLFGPELAFGKALASEHYGATNGQVHESFGIVKVAVSGTSLKQNWTADSVEYSGHAASLRGRAKVGHDLLPFLIKRARDALASDQCAGACRVKALLWVQGEKDSNVLEDGLMYESNLEAMVTAVREALAEPDLFVVIAELGLQDAAAHPGADAVRTAERRFVEKQGRQRAALVSSEGLEWMDALHYSTRGQVELGKRMADQYLNALQ